MGRDSRDVGRRAGSWSRWVLVGMPSGRGRTVQDRPLKQRGRNGQLCKIQGIAVQAIFSKIKKPVLCLSKVDKKAHYLATPLDTRFSLRDSRLETREKSQN
jgi:hypothetical protein